MLTTPASGGPVPLADGLVGFCVPLFTRHVPVWCYLLHDDRDAVLIDAGCGNLAQLVMDWFAARGWPPARLRAILLTHGHFDHAGGAAALLRWSGCPAFLHPADAPHAAGEHRYPWRAWGAKLFEPWARRAFRAEALRGAEPLRPGELLPWAGGLRVVPLPGHSPGQVGFLQERRRMLFCGDALVCTGWRCGTPLRFLNEDHAAARRTRAGLGDWPADVLWPGHHVASRGIPASALRTCKVVPGGSA